MYESSDNMTCVLPDLHLPENFTSKLQDDRENEGNFSTKEPGSVAKLLGPDSSVAYVYLGFIFDGYEKYTNVSDPKSGLQDQLYLNFVPPPVINSSTELITFDPKKEDDIQIKVRYQRDVLLLSGIALINSIPLIGTYTIYRSRDDRSSYSLLWPNIRAVLIFQNICTYVYS